MTIHNNVTANLVDSFTSNLDGNCLNHGVKWCRKIIVYLGCGSHHPDISDRNYLRNNVL